jgi:hypothetical protein
MIHRGVRMSIAGAPYSLGVATPGKHPNNDVVLRSNLVPECSFSYELVRPIVRHTRQTDVHVRCFRSPSALSKIQNKKSRSLYTYRSTETCVSGLSHGNKPNSPQSRLGVIPPRRRPTGARLNTAPRSSHAARFQADIDVQRWPS